jgi:hypothetical protein
MPSGRGSRRRGRGKKKRTRPDRERHLAVAPDSGPILVHAPMDHEEVATGSYVTACTGQRVKTPPNLVVRHDGERAYLVAGPHPRYYEKCVGCFGGEEW